MLRVALIFRVTLTVGRALDSQRDRDALRGAMIFRGTLAVGRAPAA